MLVCSFLILSRMLRQSYLLKIPSREELWIQAVGRRVAFTERVCIKTKGNGSAVPAPESRNKLPVYLTIQQWFVVMKRQKHEKFKANSN